MARNDRIARALRFAEELAKSKHGIVLRTFAERHGYNLRALYRDLELLEKAGFPIEHNQQRYRMMDGWLPATFRPADPEELLALFVARQLSAGWAQTSLGRALDRLWTKLTGGPRKTAALMPVDEPPWARVPSMLGIDYSRQKNTIETLEQGVRQRRCISARYAALSTGEITSRVIEPGELYWDPRLESLYLIGYCRLRADIRVFAVQRFKLVSLTDERFTPRRETSSQQALRHSFRIFRDTQVCRVRIRLCGPAAAEARERRWHASQSLEPDPAQSDRAILTLEVAGLDEITSFLLRLGPDAEVLEPEALRTRVVGQLRAALGRYESLTRFDAAPSHADRAGPRKAPRPARRVRRPRGQKEA